jgi:hypothetical protein
LVDCDAILWPAFGDKPRIVEVTFSVEKLQSFFTEDEDEVFQQLVASKYLGSGGSIERSHLPSKHPLIAYFRDNFFNDGSPRNESIVKVTRGAAPHGWRGNMLILKPKERMVDIHVDVDPTEDVNLSYNGFCSIHGDRETIS